LSSAESGLANNVLQPTLALLVRKGWSIGQPVAWLRFRPLFGGYQQPVFHPGQRRPPLV
jgi:hypothetical protein